MKNPPRHGDHIELLESAFLPRCIPAWAGSRARRAIETPRLLISNTGLRGHLAGLRASRLSEDSTAVDPLFDSLTEPVPLIKAAMRRHIAQERLPATTWLGVESLALDGLLIEIDAVAIAAR